MQFRLFFCLSALLFAQHLSAQGGSDQRFFEAGAKLGIVNYQGDLQEKLFTASGSQLLLGGFLRYSLSEVIAVRGVLEIGKLSADDVDSAERRDRGFSFDANLVAGELVLEYLPFGKERFSNGIFMTQFNPYIMGGLGVAYADAVVTTRIPNDPRYMFPEQDDRSVFFTVPFGAGLRYDIISGIAIGMEANWRATFSDYLDGVSVNGRPDREDWFWTFGGYASFTFGRNKEASMGF